MGLNYAGVAEVARALGIPLDEEPLRLLQRLEGARLGFLADLAKQAEAKRKT